MNLYSLYKLRAAFVRSDAVRLDYGDVRYAGSNGYGWSRSSRSSTYAYVLSINPTNVDSSSGSYRWPGLPLRCLYPGSV